MLIVDNFFQKRQKRGFLRIKQFGTPEASKQKGKKIEQNFGYEQAAPDHSLFLFFLFFLCGYAAKIPPPFFAAKRQC